MTKMRSNMAAVNYKYNYLILFLYPLYLYVTLFARYGTIWITVSYLLLLLYTLLVMLAKSITLKINSPCLLFLGFALFSLVSTWWADNRRLALMKSIHMLSMAAFLIVMYSYFASIGLMKFFLWSYIIVNCTLFMHTVFFFGFERVITFSKRLPNDLLNSNRMGMSAAFAFLCCLFLFLNHKKAIVSVLMLPLLLLAMASGSRKALIIVALGTSGYILYHFWCIGKAMSRLLHLTISATLVIALTLALSTYTEDFAASSIIRRFDILLDYFFGSGSGDGSIKDRVRMIELGWEIFGSAPFRGIGCDNARALNGGAYLHNNYIDLLANLGLIGFTLYHSLYAFILYKLWPLLRNKNQMAGFVTIILLLQLIVDYGQVSYDFPSTISQFTFAMCVADKCPPAKVKEVRVEGRGSIKGGEST